MRNIECFFVSDFLICKVYSGESYFMQNPIHSVKNVKDFIEQLCKDLEDGLYSVFS